MNTDICGYLCSSVSICGPDTISILDTSGFFKGIQDEDSEGIRTAVDIPAGIIEFLSSGI
jgi:hypothetical protein